MEGRGVYLDMLSGRGLWSSSGDSRRWGWSSGETVGLDPWMRESLAWEYQMGVGGVGVSERGRRI